MSSDPVAEEFISEQYYLWISLIATHTTFTFILYDWLLNLEEEIKLFWTRKLTAATILYFPIRYLVIIYWIMGYPVIGMKGVSCVAYFYTMDVLQLMLFVSPATFSALRVYALTGQNKVLALITLFLSLGPIYANAVHYGWEKPQYFAADSACLLIDSATPQMGILFTGLSRGLLSAGDLLVIVITVIKTIYVVKHNEGIVGPTSVARTLLFSGVIYYIPLAILNIVHMTMTVTGADQFLRTTSVVSVFMDPVTSVLASRFLLNLRKVEEGRHATEPTAWETLQFTPGGARTLPPFIASMGELVDFAFVNSETSSTGGSEDLEMTSTDCRVGDSANVPSGLKGDSSATTMASGDESRIELGNMIEKVVPSTIVV